MSTVKMVGRNIIIETSTGARIDVSPVEANELINQIIDVLDDLNRTERGA